MLAVRVATPSGLDGVVLTKEERTELTRFVERHGFRGTCRLLGVGEITLRSMRDGERVQERTRDRVPGMVRGDEA